MTLTYWERKAQQICTYPGCERSPADGHGQCQQHRDQHRERNRKWKRMALARIPSFG